MEMFAEANFDKDRRKRRITEIKKMASRRKHNYDMSSSRGEKRPAGEGRGLPVKRRRLNNTTSTSEPELNALSRVARLGNAYRDDTSWTMDEVRTGRILTRYIP
jgi:hypothetical protein